MSRTLLELNGLLGIKSIWTSVYRRQTDGLVERLNKALKSAICKFVRKDDCSWDRGIDPDCGGAFTALLVTGTQDKGGPEGTGSHAGDEVIKRA